jgi:hypothetical protein
MAFDMSRRGQWIPVRALSSLPSDSLFTFSPSARVLFVQLVMLAQPGGYRLP